MCPDSKIDLPKAGKGGKGKKKMDIFHCVDSVAFDDKTRFTIGLEVLGPSLQKFEPMVVIAILASNKGNSIDFVLSTVIGVKHFVESASQSNNLQLPKIAPATTIRVSTASFRMLYLQKCTHVQGSNIFSSAKVYREIMSQVRPLCLEAEYVSLSAAQLKPISEPRGNSMSRSVTDVICESVAPFDSSKLHEQLDVIEAKIVDESKKIASKLTTTASAMTGVTTAVGNLSKVAVKDYTTQFMSVSKVRFKLF